jgi:chromosome segregation ATPase
MAWKAGTLNMVKPHTHGSTPRNIPESQPHMDYGTRDHSFVLQSIMEQQKALGSVEKELSTLKAAFKDHSEILHEARDKSLRFEVQLSHVEKVVERTCSDFEKGISELKLLIDKSTVTQKEHLALTLAPISQLVQQVSAEIVKIDKSVEELKSFRWKFGGALIVISVLASGVVAYLVRALAT